MMMWLATIGSTVGIATASTDIDWSAKEWLKWNTGVKWIQWVWEENRKGSALLDVIKNAVNWVLWMLSLITLCIVMVTAAGDDGKYKKWFTILKQAWIWLIIILLAWIIVSVVFWLVNSVWWASEAGDGTTK